MVAKIVNIRALISIALAAGLFIFAASHASAKPFAQPQECDPQKYMSKTTITRNDVMFLSVLDTVTNRHAHAANIASHHDNEFQPSKYRTTIKLSTGATKIVGSNNQNAGGSETKMCEC